MKNLVLYLLLIVAVPAVAQPGHPLIKAGPHARLKKHHQTHHETLGMNPKDYSDAVRIISEENFDSKRLAAAKRIVAVNPMSTHQIAGICKLFNFESNRLEFAKYAYRHCVDPNKYFFLDDVFAFEASKKELYDFIRGR